MKFRKLFALAIVSALLFASCSSAGRMSKGGGGCSCNKGMVGY